jgi:hypothetical protein
MVKSNFEIIIEMLDELKKNWSDKNGKCKIRL